MKPVLTRRRSCRLCEGSRQQSVLKLAPSPIPDEYLRASAGPREQPLYPLELFLCLNCGFLQILDVIDPEVLYRNYIYATTSSLGLATHFDGYAGEVLAKVGLKPDSLVVDIGSNDGTLLRAFQRRGMQVLGVDPAKEIARQATESGVETIPEFFDQKLALLLRKEHGPAALITMNNLFANIDDLKGAVAAVARFLSPDGVFVFETSYLVKLVENLVFDFIYHEHLSYSTVKPLAAFFEKLGLELIDVEDVPTKGGSIRCAVQLAGGPRKKSDSVARHIVAEEKLGLHEPGPYYSAFAARIDREKEKLSAELENLAHDGKTVAGYGASATTTTLIYHFVIQRHLSFLADENPAKQGTLSPGCHIPVVSPKAWLARKPDVTLILAWRYADAIAKKHEDYVRAGGRFLVPLPALRWV